MFLGFFWQQRMRKVSAVVCIAIIITTLIPAHPSRAESPLCTTEYDIMLSIDRSGSMAGQKILDAINAAQDFVDLLNPAFHNVGLVTYADSALMNIDLTNDLFSVQSKIAMITTTGNTNISQGISVAHNQATWREGGVTKVIILLTDGVPTGGDTPENVRNTSNAAKDDNIILFTIGLGSDADDDLLMEAASSPNFYFNPNTSGDLVAIYQIIAALLCCGNGIQEPVFGEECDDGNHEDNDGCSASCKVTHIDIGLKIPIDGEVIPIAIEPPGVESPLRIAKNGTVYRISLVDPSHSDATAIRIMTPDGIKALRRFNPSSENVQYQLIW
jgi:cysteine-rich repeat protein